MNTVFDFRKADNWVTSPAFISASGGTESTSGDYKIHTFTSTSTPPAEFPPGVPPAPPPATII